MTAKPDQSPKMPAAIPPTRPTRARLSLCRHALARQHARLVGRVASGDLALLYGAVTARLRMLVGDDVRAACAGRDEEPSARIRTGVLECVAALDQRHSTLAHEIARHPPLDAAAREALAARLPAPVEPVGSKAGSNGPIPGSRAGS